MSNWDVSKVTNMTSMFEGATAANPDVSGWVVSSVTGTGTGTDTDTDIGMTNMFNSSGLSKENYDAFLINLANNNTSVEDVILGAIGIYYTSDDAKAARDTLAKDRNWTITDGGDYAALFRSTWRVSADDETITLPLVDDAMYTYNFTVDWGDGSPISEITSFGGGDKTHTYEAAGDYNLVIEGTLEAWSFNNAGDKDKILSVESFGDLGYKNLSGAFHGSTNLSAFAGGVTSAVTNMSFMFYNTPTNPDVGDWNVSKVINMNAMFQGATNATPDVGDWNVSEVTNMNDMFRGATSATPDVSNWNVSAVTSMASMFLSATSANPDVSSWTVSAVTRMDSMFYGAPNANPDVSSWTVSAVTNMTNMFNGSGLSTANYDAFLINLAGHDPAVTDVTLGAGTIQYSSDDAKTARDTLTNDRRWIITDGEDATP